MVKQSGVSAPPWPSRSQPWPRGLHASITGGTCTSGGRPGERVSSVTSAAPRQTLATLQRRQGRDTDGSTVMEPFTAFATVYCLPPRRGFMFQPMDPKMRTCVCVCLCVCVCVCVCVHIYLSCTHTYPTRTWPGREQARPAPPTRTQTNTNKHHRARALPPAQQGRTVPRRGQSARGSTAARKDPSDREGRGSSAAVSPSTR